MTLAIPTGNTTLPVYDIPHQSRRTEERTHHGRNLVADIQPRQRTHANILAT
jgi:hypothetical protein